MDLRGQTHILLDNQLTIGLHTLCLSDTVGPITRKTLHWDCHLLNNTVLPHLLDQGQQKQKQKQKNIGTVIY